jgi:hypothetical protein
MLVLACLLSSAALTGSTPASAAPASAAPASAAPASDVSAGDGAASAPTGRPCKAAVLDLTPGEGVTLERAQSLTEVVTGEVGAHLGCTVLSRAEIKALVSFEVERQLSGCDTSGCLAEIGDALGVDQLVLGTMSRIDSRSLVSLRLVDMHTMQVRRRVTDSYEGEDKDALRWIGWLARRLAMPDEADAGPRPEVDKPTVLERRATLWRTLAWTGVGTGAGVLVVGGALGAAALGISGALPAMKTARGANRSQIESLEEAGPWLAGGANLGLYVGAGLLAVGGALFFFPGEELVEHEARR